MYILLYYLIGYRKKVIQDNLAGSFPDLNEKELKKLVKKSYRNLTDILIEGIKVFIMSKGQIRKRHRMINPELLDRFYKKGKSVIIVTGHYGNWEWGSLSSSLFIKHHVIGFYKPLTNPHVDRFLKWSRSRTGSELASIFKTTQTFKEGIDIPSAFLMAADQSPSKDRNAHWVNFLGRETAFLHGPAKHAIQNKLPIVYVNIQRTKRGYYETHLSVLVDDPTQYSPIEITQLFASKLETVIRKKPENWLWSHRRWKLKPKEEVYS
jgi:KDO2-lipid IV(A) lauroyltransferase